MGIISEDGIIIRRNIASAGKSRAYINDSLVNIQSLSAIGKPLVDMHSQHEHQSLLSTDNQRTLLDFYGKPMTKGQRLRQCFMKFSH